MISDKHGLHRQFTALPEGDVLVPARDFMNSGYDPEDIWPFNRWLRDQPFESRIVIGGNHDRYFQNSPAQARALLTNAGYLENTGVTINGVSFWGSPNTPAFLNWAFMYPRGTAAERYWNQIPAGLDFLVTHGPPFGILDQVEPGGEHLGCQELLKAVEEKKPKVHIFGHIHGGAEIADNGTTQFINAAYLNEAYRPLAPAGQIRIFEL
jgi:predicted phosphohydrolase